MCQALSAGPGLLVGTLSSFSARSTPMVVQVRGISSRLLPLPCQFGSRPRVFWISDRRPAVARARIDATLYRRQHDHHLPLNGLATGNIASLAGRTLYRGRYDPHSLFQATPRVFLSGSSAQRHPSGRTQAAGLKEGLKIYVCVIPPAPRS